MKVQVIYTSLTGCTERVAQAIYEGLPGEDKSIHNLRDGIPVLDGDILLLGYWGVSGGPCEEMAALLRSIRDKAVGVFCTLGYYAGTTHAQDTVQAGVALVKDRNRVLGTYVCSGAVSPELTRDQGERSGTPTQQKELRWAIGDRHPTDAECALAAERFRERVWLYQRCVELQIPFSSIL